METIPTISANFDTKLKNWLETPEADLMFVQSQVANHDYDAETREKNWLKTVAKHFDTEVSAVQNFSIVNGSGAMLPQTVVRNVVRKAQTSGLLTLVTKFEGVQSVAWNIMTRGDFNLPETWTTTANAHVWSAPFRSIINGFQPGTAGVANTTTNAGGTVNAAAGVDETVSATLKVEQNLKVINLNIVATFVYKYTKLPRRLTVLHPQLIGMVLDELATEVVRSIEAAIAWGSILQSDDTTVNLDFLKPISPVANPAVANRVIQMSAPTTGGLLPIISTMRTVYGFWNGFEQPPHIVMNGVAWRELYNQILAKLQSLVAIQDPIKAILGYTKEEIERELGMKIHVVHEYNLANDPYTKTPDGATAKFICGDLKAYGALLPAGMIESFTFFKLQRNEEELLSEVLIGGDVIDIAKLVYTEVKLS